MNDHIHLLPPSSLQRVTMIHNYYYIKNDIPMIFHILGMHGVDE